MLFFFLFPFYFYRCLRRSVRPLFVPFGVRWSPPLHGLFLVKGVAVVLLILVAPCWFLLLFGLFPAGGVAVILLILVGLFWVVLGFLCATTSCSCSSSWSCLGRFATRAPQRPLKSPHTGQRLWSMDICAFDTVPFAAR